MHSINAVRGSRPYFKTTFAILLVLLVCGSSIAQDKAAINTTITGTLTTSLGNPARSVDVLITVNSLTPVSVSTNSQGVYVHDTSVTITRIRIQPYTDSTIPGIYVDAEPAVYDENHPHIVDDTITRDFTIHPVVVAYLNTGAVNLNHTGTRIYIGGTWVATSAGGPWTIFSMRQYPWLEHAGDLWFSRPFTDYTPQNQNYLTSYDCTYKAIDQSPSSRRQQAVEKLDPTTTYSWNTGSGPGWEYFPATPDSRVPNNPNVFVEADFHFQNGVWPWEFIRMNDVHPQEDLLPGNGYKAVFRYPITDCSRGDYNVEIYYETGGGGYWEPLVESKFSGTSNMDLNGDDILNLSDAGFVTAALGSCDGEPNWNPCVDYFPSGCIDAQDTGIWADIYFNYPQKALRGESGADVAGLVALSDRERQVRFFPRRDWVAILARISPDRTEQGKLEFVPDADHLESAVLVELDNGDYGVGVFGGGPSGIVTAGRLLAGEGEALPGLELSSVEVLYENDFRAEKNAPAGRPRSVTGFEAATPNPFNPQTKIFFTTSASATVDVDIYDIGGRLVRRLISGEVKKEGRHEANWNGRDAAGRPVSAGTYICRLSADGVTDALRLTLLK